jgi:hypothetical protein
VAEPDSTEHVEDVDADGGVAAALCPLPVLEAKGAADVAGRAGDDAPTFHHDIEAGRSSPSIASL